MVSNFFITGNKINVNWNNIKYIKSKNDFISAVWQGNISHFHLVYVDVLT